jgi:hypothetical protein
VLSLVRTGKISARLTINAGDNFILWM